MFVSTRISIRLESSSEYQVLDDEQTLVFEGRETLTDLNYLNNPVRALRKGRQSQLRCGYPDSRLDEGTDES